MPESPFAADAVNTNRLGQLTDAQRHGFRAMAASNRRDMMKAALPFLAIGLLIWFFASPNVSEIKRTLVSGGFLAVAAALVLRSLSGTDALTRDVAEGRVASAEGAIGKRRLSSGGSRRTTHYLDVGDLSIRVAYATYEAAPDVGFVRLFFFPRSRKFVNLEILPTTPVSPNENFKDAARALGKAAILGDQRERNEARAGVERLGDALKSSWSQAEHAPAPGDPDPRPLAEAIVGTWASGVIRVTFGSDGRLTLNMLGAETAGRWSAAGGDRLNAELNGRPGTAEAHITGNQLTIVLEGRRLTLTRA